MFPNSTIVSLVAALVAYCFFAFIKGLGVNITIAQRTGLPYVVARKSVMSFKWSSTENRPTNHSFHQACSPFNLLWQIPCGIWTPLIKLLPKSWWESWLE